MRPGPRAIFAPKNKPPCSAPRVFPRLPWRRMANCGREDGEDEGASDGEDDRARLGRGGVSMISSAAGKNRRSSGVRFCGVWAWRMAQAAPKARAVRTARLEAAWSRGAMDAVMVVLIAFLILSRGEQPPARYA